MKQIYLVIKTQKEIYDRGYGYIDPVTGDDGAGYITTKTYEVYRVFKTLKGAMSWREKNQKFEGEYLITQAW